ncbi:MAG: hypothetical protein JRJ85_04950 [Deltaproteobacteria bacterium]|nr:hypothetical protein [Deltaproteobacteria bacterium]
MKSVNRRKYFRGEISVPARFQVLTDREVQMVEKGFGRTLFKHTDVPSPIEELLDQTIPGSSDEQLYRCLQLINNKLDFIIDQIFLKTSEVPLKRGDVTEISGSGIKFKASEYLRKGTLLKMDIVLPATLQYQIDLIAETVRLQEMSSGFVIAAKMIEIDEEARDAIIKVVLQRQRIDIRSRKIEKVKNDH